MSVKGLYFFQCGTLELDKSITTYRQGMGEKIRIPVMAALIDTSEGFILFDTGLSPAGIDNPEAIWTEHIRSLIVDFNREHDIREPLKAMGIGEHDIRFVINSHLHYDHTGSNYLFSRSRFVVQLSEYRFARNPDPFAAGPYLENHLEIGREPILLDGDHLFADGIYLMFTPGHTPGHQSLILDLPETGSVILAADAIFCEENIEKDIPSGNCWNPALAMNSMHRLVQTAKREKARLFITHDPSAGQTILPYPHCYR